jgi:hypothetical protein
VHELDAPGARSAATPSPSLAADDALVVAIQHREEAGEATWSLLTVDRDLRTWDATSVRDDTYTDVPAAAAPAPIEQLHPIEYEGQLHALLTVRDRNMGGVAQTGLAAIQNGALRNLRLLSEPANGRHERHWAPFSAGEGLYAVSWWEPTETRRIDGGAEASHRPVLRPAPRLAERFLDASPGVSVSGGWLFLVNEPAGADGDGALTFSRFVFMRSDFAVTAVSPHFWVESRGQDRASGLARLGDELIAGFTGSGNSAILTRIPMAAVIDSLLPLASPGVLGRRDENGQVDSGP